jgi:CheY-like chemotaxis protein
MPSVRHVLLVDDHPEMRAVLAYVVPRFCSGVTIAEASDGTEALNAVAQQCPDLIITDVQMPIMGGLELIRTLRAQGMQMPILAASSEPDIAEGILTAGANHFLPKPFPLPELRMLLRRLLCPGDAAQAVGA